MNLSMFVKFFVCAVCLFTVGCSGPAANTTVGVPTDCVFPDVPGTSAPEWICDTPVEGVEISAVGFANKSAAGAGFMKEIAAAQARSELARQIEVHITDMVKRYVETTGVGNNETVDMVSTVISKQVTDQTVAGSRIYRSATSPSGAMYTLVGYDEKMLSDISKRVLRSSYADDAAQWQQMRAEKSFDELTDEILTQ